MKEILLVILGDDALLESASVLFFCLALGIALTINPAKIKYRPIRYIYSFLWAASFVLLATAPVLGIAGELSKKEFHVFVLLGYLLLWPLALALIVLKTSSFANKSPKLSQLLRMQKGFTSRDSWSSLFLFLPSLCLFFIMRWAVGGSFIVPSLGVIALEAIYIPLAEELSFRLLLPCAAKEDEANVKDYLLFSIFFLVMHLKASSLAPFLFSLFAYGQMSFGKKILFPILAHVFFNLIMLGFAH